MRETIKEWRDEWIETNGPTGELEVVITDTSRDISRDELYSGSFADIPPELLDKKVIEKLEDHSFIGSRADWSVFFNCIKIFVFAERKIL